MRWRAPRLRRSSGRGVRTIGDGDGDGGEKAGTLTGAVHTW